MDERRGRPEADIPTETDLPPLPGGEPPPASRAAPPLTGDPVLDADPEGAGTEGAIRLDSAVGAGRVGDVASGGSPADEDEAAAHEEGIGGDDAERAGPARRNERTG